MKAKRNTCAPVSCAMIVLLALCPAIVLTAWAIAMPSSACNVVMAAGPAPQSAGPSPVAGEWQGKLGRQHLLLKIEQPPDAPIKATLILPDNGNISLAIDTVSWDQGTTLRLEIKQLGASYEGKLSTDGTEIVGTWKQGGQSPALLFLRPGAALKSTLKPRTQGQIALEPCRTSDGNVEALCGSYQVYENRESQKGRRIGLNIMVLPAMAEKPESDPFVALAGGPGGSATELYPLAGYVTEIRAQRDVVLVDQRGTGKSNPLPCTLLDVNNPQAVLGDPYSMEKIRECRAASEKKADLSQYTTSIAADDLDEIRGALGYDKMNIFGSSYGTKAALVYLRRHGDHVRTLTLEAVASPQYLNPLPFAKALQSSVDGIIALCAADAACHKDYPDLRKEFDAVLERLAKSPAHFELGNQSVTLSHEMFLSKLRAPLYFPQIISAFPLMIHHAYENDWSRYGYALLELTKALDGVVARGANFAAACAEDLPGMTEAAIHHETQGTYLGDSQVRRFQQYCQAWGPAGSIPKDFYAPVRSSVPTLLISGVLDPATPPQTAEQASRYLTNSYLVAVKQGTHGTGSPCIDGLIARFVQAGSSATLDASCTDQIHLPPFLANSHAERSATSNGYH